MRRTFLPVIAAALPLVLPVLAAAQTAQTPQNQDLWISINKPSARKVAIAVPDLLTPGTATLKSTVTDPFTATLRSDLEYSGAFAVADPAHYPAGQRDPRPPRPPMLARGGAEYLADARPRCRATGSRSRRGWTARRVR